MTSQGDNCAGCHGAALSSALTDLQGHGSPGNVPPVAVFASWVGGYKMKPKSLHEHAWAVFLDPTTKSVVISVRGTLSATDLVTDLFIDEKVLPPDGSSEGRTGESSGKEVAHAGAFLAAERITNAILSCGILHDLLDRGCRPKVCDALGRCCGTVHVDDSDVDWTAVKSYKLVLTGHSLGAGIASIIAWMLRANPVLAHWRPRLTARLISPVGGLLSSAAAARTDEYTISLTCGE